MTIQETAHIRNVRELGASDVGSFSYAEYATIINRLLQQHDVVDFAEIGDESACFCVVRHDIEYSIPRAVQLAEVEHQLGVQSSYFVQLRSPFYNAFAHSSWSQLERLSDLGHAIGLHTELPRALPRNAWPSWILGEIAQLEALIGRGVDRFSIHQPRVEHLVDGGVTVAGLINAYGPRFFEFRNARAENFGPTIKYVSDSKHRWQWGYPDDALVADHPRIQILLHPDEWSDAGAIVSRNFAELADEARVSFLDTARASTSYFENE